MSFSKFTISSFIIASAIQSVAIGQLTHQWTNSTGNSLWSRTGNWIIQETGAVVTSPPGASSKVLIAGPIGQSLINHNAGTVRQMEIGAEGLSGQLRIGSGSLTVTLPVDIGYNGGANGLLTLDSGLLDVEMVRVGRGEGGVSRLVVNGGTLRTRRVASQQGGSNDPAIYLTSALPAYGGSTGDAFMEVHGGTVEVEGTEPSAGNFNVGKWDVDLKSTSGNANLLINGGTVYARTVDMRNTGESTATLTAVGGNLRGDRIRSGTGQSDISIRGSASVKLGRNIELGSGVSLNVEGSSAVFFSARPLTAFWAETGSTVYFIAAAGGFTPLTTPGWLAIGTGVTLNIDATALGAGEYPLFTFTGGTSTTNNHGSNFVLGNLQTAPGFTGYVVYEPHSIKLSIQEIVPVTVQAKVFHSGFTGSGTPQWDAIDSVKQLAVQGTGPRQLTLENITNSGHGLNGLVFDFQNRPNGANLSLQDFEFRVSPSGSFDQSQFLPEQWQLASIPTSFGVSPITAGLERVLVKWPNNVIHNRWLRVVVKATPQTGLAAPITLFIGNLVGEMTGSEGGKFVVLVADLLAVRSQLGNVQPASGPADIDKSGVVLVADILAVREMLTEELTAITIP
ncbi:MAG TPA: hypothetical protein DCF63_00765 [Planctomycetaceae bacterium]|nr:hypothetical protein [Planctomycetaceae bacterium]